MIDANAYRIRFATREDADELARLAERDSKEPLVRRVLIGYIDGTPAAALSVHDGRAIADPSRSTDHVVAVLRMRAGAIKAFEAMPSLRQRLLAALPAYRGRSKVVTAPVSRDEDESMRIAA
jgi:hypothetical protein